MTQTKAQKNLQINSAAISDKGLSKKRPNNEDSYLELRDCGLFAVADGVGGAQAGDVASQMAMEILGEAFINLQEGGDAEERMKLAIEQANNAIFQMSNDLAKLSTMATTVVGLHLRQNVATIGHVGDSRLYRLDPEGNLYQETQDHSVVEEEVRAGRMTPLQASVHPSRNVISRALGAEETVEVDMKTIMFEPDTTFLVCSDGVTRHIPDDELRELLFSEEDTFAICQRIKNTCFERGAEDNLTAVVAKVVEQGESETKANGAMDFDEETIATAKPPLVNSGLLTNTQSVDSEDLGEPVGSPELNEEPLKKAKLDDPLHDAADSEIQLEDGETLSIKTDKGRDSKLPKTADKVEDVKSYRLDEKAVPDVLGSVLGVLPWVILGVALTLLGFLVWSQWFGSVSPEDVSELNTRSENVVLTAFEKNRRNVDNDPGKYIANSAVPKDAVDHYLLGRAHLLEKNYEEAKVHLESAKSKLNDGVSPTNKKVLENEIPMLLAIVNNPDARKGFETRVSEEKK